MRAMITPSPNVPRETIAQSEAQRSARAEPGENFRDVVSRGRERAGDRDRARETDDAHSPEARRAARLEAARQGDRIDSSRAAEDAAASDTSAHSASEADTPDAGHETDSGLPARAASAQAVGRTDGQAEAVSKPGPKYDDARPNGGRVPASDVETLAGDEVRRALAALSIQQLVGPNVAIDTVRALSAQGIADADGPTDDAATTNPSANTTTSTTPKSADAALLAAPASERPTLAHADLPRELRTLSSADAKSGIVAITPGAPTIVAELAAPTAPVSVARLTPAELPQFLDGLAVRVDGPAASAFVELEPVDLGRLTIELSLQPEGGVRAEVRAERPDGFAAIEARLPELRASLIGRGFASADVQLSLGLSQRDSRGNPEPSSPRRSRRDAGRGLDTERVLALAPSPSGSIDLWA
jgi:flagellar hook-length control protein FliK